MLKSDYTKLVPVVLPYKGRQRYMHSFDVANPIMLGGYEDYLEPVLSLLWAVSVHRGTAHMTVDEKVVKAGWSQRRPKPHVDGCFNGHDWQHPTPGWNHYCNHLPVPRMAVIVAASEPGCVAWRGEFEGEPRRDGDLSHLELGKGELLQANTGYLLSPDCIHESLVMERDTRRTFLRIALPLEFNQ